MGLEHVLTIVGTAVAILALVVAIGTLFATAYPIWLQHRRETILRERFARGPYDLATIQRSTRYYIAPKCSNLDPSQEVEMRHALTATREDLFTAVDRFLNDDQPCRHLLILADSGTGKTSFILNYYVRNARRPKRRRHLFALAPLGVPDSLALIAAIQDKENTTLFLDALDEDVAAREDHRHRVSALMESCRAFRRVIITCRTQFFPRDEEIPVETGILRLGPLKAGDKSIYEFRKLYLSPFTDAEVEIYLRLRYPFWRVLTRRKARRIAEKIPNLTARPMLLAHIPDLVNSETEVATAVELYEVMITAWFERETAWVDKRALREFSERLAVELYTKREVREMERIPRKELEGLAQSWGLELFPWQIAGRSLLNRDAQGNYKFAHRSVMEYLFVLRLVKGDPYCQGVLLTDQMKTFLLEILLGPRASFYAPIVTKYDIAGRVVSAARFATLERENFSLQLRIDCREVADELVDLLLADPFVRERGRLGSWPPGEGESLVAVGLDGLHFIFSFEPTANDAVARASGSYEVVTSLDDPAGNAVLNFLLSADVSDKPKPQVDVIAILKRYGLEGFKDIVDLSRFVPGLQLRPRDAEARAFELYFVPHD